jgi:hypothetical protein
MAPFWKETQLVQTPKRKGKQKKKKEKKLKGKAHDFHNQDVRS